jgi:hypothetical protein
MPPTTNNWPRSGKKPGGQSVACGQTRIRRRFRSHASQRTEIPNHSDRNKMVRGSRARHSASELVLQPATASALGPSLSSSKRSSIYPDRPLINADYSCENLARAVPARDLWNIRASDPGCRSRPSLPKAEVPLVGGVPTTILLEPSPCLGRPHRGRECV